ncbi:MAG: hypothetical protein ACTIJJ_07045 [Galactobacter sp.]
MTPQEQETLDFHNGRPNVMQGNDARQLGHIIKVSNSYEVVGTYAVRDGHIRAVAPR